MYNVQQRVRLEKKKTFLGRWFGVSGKPFRDVSGLFPVIRAAVARKRLGDVRGLGFGFLERIFPRKFLIFQVGLTRCPRTANTPCMQRMRERGRERERDIYIYIHIDIYIERYRDRERETERERERDRERYIYIYTQKEKERYIERKRDS